MGSHSPYPGKVCDLLLQQSPICQWAINAECNLVYVHGNSGPIPGKPPDELQGRNLSDLLSPEAFDLWAPRIRLCFAGESAEFRESFGTHSVSVHLFPLRAASGEVILAGGIAQDITALMAAEEDLRNSTLMLLRAQENERNRLAQFLHDDVGQALSAAGMQLDLMRMDMVGRIPSVGERTAEVQRTLETIMERVREYSYALNPSVVERAGLRWALDRLVGRIRRSFSGTLRLMYDPTLQVPAPVAKAFYQIAQEALENALKHAKCSLIELLIKSARAGVMIEIRDNGTGFDPDSIPGSHRGLGLLSMKHWAGEAGLQLTISSERGAGTVVCATYAAAS